MRYHPCPAQTCEEAQQVAMILVGVQGGAWLEAAVGGQSTEASPGPAAATEASTSPRLEDA